jgi:glycosyltransferase involved in cell wall biosynthesis
MRILFTTEALTIGGIEVLALRFSEAFGAAGHEVTLYDFEPANRVESLVAKFDQSKFRIASFDKGPALNWLVWKINAVLFKSGLLRSGFRRRLIEKHFADYLATHKPDVICSLSFQQDYLACRFAPPLGIPVVVSMHGIYEAVAPDHPALAKAIYEQVSAIIYAADKNMSYYKAQPYFRPEMPTYKIYTGTNLDEPVPVTVTRADLGIAEDAFLYILVARGIKEKGWQEAIAAFSSIRARHPHAALLLVGEGEFLQQMKAQHQVEPGLFFHGFHPSSVELTRLADVGILPTYFAAETMPNVIIDYLRCGLPVVATAIGEIADMLSAADGQQAGTVIPLSAGNNSLSVDHLAAAMEQYVAAPAFYEQQRELVQQVRRKFDIKDCMAGYLTVFGESIRTAKQK